MTGSCDWAGGAILAAACAVGIALHRTRPPQEPSAPFTRMEGLCLAALLTLAAVLRIAALEDLPPFFEAKELNVGGFVEDMCDPRSGHLQHAEPYFDSWSMGSTWLAARLSADLPWARGALAGKDGPPVRRRIGTLRLANALFGVALVFVVWAIGRVCDGPVPALGGAAFAALSERLVLQCRVGVQASDAALWPMVTLLCFCLGLRSGRWIWHLAAGLALGVAMRTFAADSQAAAGLFLSMLAGLCARPAEHWRLYSKALVPLVVGISALSLSALGTALGRPPDYLLGHAVQTTIVTDPLPQMLDALWANLRLSLGGVLGLTRPPGHDSPVLPLVVGACFAIAALAPRRVRIAGAGLVIFGFACTSFVPAIVSRDRNLSLRTLGPAVAMTTLVAGHGAGHLRAALAGRPWLARLVVPAAVLYAASAFLGGQARILQAVDEAEAYFSDLHSALRMAPTFTLFYTPAHHRFDRIGAVDWRALQYLEWAYPLNPLTPGVLVPDVPLDRPAAFLLEYPEHPSDLRRLYPRGEEVALERAGQVTKLLAVSARDVAALQGWLLAPSVAEGGRLLDEELGPVDWWLGSARIPRAGAYEFRVTGSGSVGLKLGRWAVERGNRQACASGVFLEGYCPLAIADSQGHAGRPPEVWWRSPVWGGQWRRLPDCAVRRGLIGQPTQRPGGAWIAGPGEDDPTRAQVEPGLLAESMPSGHGLRIGVRADTSIAPLSWDTWETGIRASPPFVWVLRWLPVPLWRFRLDGAVASPPAASGAATYRGRPVYADPIPSASIELDGPDGVIMSDPGMRKLVRLSTASPKWQVWPQDGEVQNPVSLSRLPGSGWLAVGHSRGLMVLDAAGRIVRDWEGRPPADVACDSADRICQLLPFEGVIAVCDASGAELGRWRCSELTPESRLAIDRQDRLWVLTPETGEVLVFSGSGELLAPPTRIVSRRIADSRGLVHREEPPGDIDCGPDGVLRVLLDGRLLTLSP